MGLYLGVFWLAYWAVVKCAKKQAIAEVGKEGKEALAAIANKKADRKEKR